ncbi:uncharacterized protein LOC133395103, partial [Anopheles gambiae]|uniref:uncharacterized protein LOC133395103 n=1 Tax=Anopheles gambiae TaxID=7165 RepID=UPI002AC9628E
FKTVEKIKSKAYADYSRTRSSLHSRIFFDALNNYRRHNRVLYRSFIRRTERQLFSKPTRFWSFWNKRRNIRSIPPSMSYNGQTSIDTSDICNTLANRFADAFTLPVLNPNTLAEATRNTPSDAIDFIIPTIDEALIARTLNDIKPSTSSGPDNIPAYILKHCRQSLAPILAKIFNDSLMRGTYPESWKHARMIPIHKKGSRLHASNPWQSHHARPTYHQRCLLLGLEPLCSRRKNAQCLFIFRLLNGEIDSPALLASINLFAPCRILRSNFHLRVPRTRNNHSQGHPIIRMSLEFNEVLDLFDFSMSTSTFKEKLRLRHM